MILAFDTLELDEDLAPEATSPPVLFGRESELQALLAALARVEHGHGLLVLLAGEPGIGKTRLLERFAAHARARGAEVSWGRAWEGGGAHAFWPFIQVLRELVLRQGLDAIRTDLGPGAADLLPLIEFKSAALEDENTIEGMLSFIAEGPVLGSDGILNSGMIGVTPSSTATPFVARRAPDDYACADTVADNP